MSSARRTFIVVDAPDDPNTDNTEIVLRSADGAPVTLSGVDHETIPSELGAASPGAAPGASPADHVHQAPLIGDIGGFNLSGATDGATLVYDGTSGDVVARQPLWDHANSALITLPRITAGQDSKDYAPLAAGTVYLTFFRATSSLNVGHVKFNTGSTAASGSTLAKIGVYSVNETTGALALLGSSPSQASGLGGQFAQPSIALSAAVATVAGSVYAVAALQVGGTPASILGCFHNNQFLGLRPRLSATRSGQTDLPASITDGQLGDYQLAFFYALTA